MITVATAGETATINPVINSGPAGFTKLYWSDTFPGPGVDLAKWNVHNNVSNNNNYAWYLAANATVQSDGLHLRANRQSGLPGQPSTSLYTSGYVDTIGKVSLLNARWEIVAKLPSAKGLWPALWLRCDSTLGEIDIMEAVDPLNDDVETVHQSTNGDMDKSGYEFKPTGLDLTQFHEFALERDLDGTVRWFVNKTLNRTRKPTDLDNQGKPMTWLNGPTFASPLNLRMNLQVGGSMPKSFGMDVDSTSVLPADFVISSVKIYIP